MTPAQQLLYLTDGRQDGRDFVTVQSMQEARRLQAEIRG